jgi:hypothetical protein
MGFSVFVEALNLMQRRRARPVHLRQPYAEAAPAGEGGATGHGS